MNYRNLAEEIIAMKNADLELREKLIQQGTLSDGYSEEMASLHNQNAMMLDKIMDKIGFPTIDHVGVEASEAAWLVVQHAIGLPTFMRKCGALLEKAVNESKASSIGLAYLQDRIAVFESKPQLYGTQFDWDANGKLSPNEVDNWIEVNKRRKLIGLNTLEEQLEVMRKRAQNENQTPPTDFKKRKQEMDVWRKNVGWIK